MGNHRDFEKVQSYIPNLSKAAAELIKQGYEIGYNDDLGTGKVYLQSRSVYRNKEDRFKLLKRCFGKVEIESNATLESTVESILKVLTNEAGVDVESEMLLLACEADLHLESCCDEY